MAKLKQNAGFSYPAVLVVVAVTAIFAQRIAINEKMQARREVEHRIIAQGDAFVWALQSYWLANKENPELPQNIDQLLGDQRYGFDRHLRGALVSPFEDDEWQLLFDANNRIQGIYLNSERKPVRKNIISSDGSTKKIETYSDWFFEFKP